MNEHQAPRRAAIYARVSTLQQEDNSSLQTQEEGCRRAAPERDYVIDEAHVYRDIESGRLLYERPAVLALRDAIHRHAIDAVLVYDLDRLVRDQDFLAMLFGEANYAGVEIEFVTSRWDKTPEGTLLRNIAGYVAQKEHEKIRERMMRGHRARAESGKILPGGRGRALYGYDWTAGRTAYTPNETEATIVRWIFERAASGASIRSIAQELTDAGVPTANGGPTWYSSSIHSILKHPAYRGEPMAYRWLSVAHKTLDRRTGELRTVYTKQERPPAERIPLSLEAVPPLVSPELARVVAQRLALNKAQARRNNHHPEETLLRNGFAVCGYCGRNLIANYARGAGYNCLHNGPGNALFIAASILDTAIWAAVRKVVLDPSIIEAELENNRKDPPKGELQDLEKQLRAISAQQARLANRLGLVSEEASQPIIAELERLAAQKRALQQKRDELLQQIKSWETMLGEVHNIREWCEEVGRQIDTFTYPEKRNALVALQVETRVYRRDHEPRFEVEMHIPLGGSEFRRVLLNANVLDCDQTADGRL